MSDKTKYYLKWAAIGAVVGILTYRMAPVGKSVFLGPIDRVDMELSLEGATLAVLIAWLLERKSIKDRSIKVKAIILIIALTLAGNLLYMGLFLASLGGWLG